MRLNIDYQFDKWIKIRNFMVRKNKGMNSYPTNLTDNQWQVIEKFLDVQERKRKYPLRNIVNAIIWFNNTLGRVYFAFIYIFHKLIVGCLLRRAIRLYRLSA